MKTQRTDLVNETISFYQTASDMLKKREYQKSVNINPKIDSGFKQASLKNDKQITRTERSFQ